MKLEEHMDDRQSFEMAMFRARMKAEEEGLNPTFREMLDLAQKELEEEHARLAKSVAEIRGSSGSSPSTPEASESPQSDPSQETEPQV